MVIFVKSTNKNLNRGVKADFNCENQLSRYSYRVQFAFYAFRLHYEF